MGVCTVDWTALATFALACTTVWLGFKTRAAARAAQATHLLEARPYLAFKEVSVSFDANTHIGGVGIILNNPGRVLVFYRMTQFVAAIGGQGPNPPKLPSTTVPVYPGGTITYYSGPIAGIATPPPTAQGVARFKLEYWDASEADKHTVEVDLTVELIAKANGLFDGHWRYASDPIIT